jgi:formylglycine-generating enzyme required for sulfatase activity
MSGNLWEWTSSLYQPYPYVADDDKEADTGDRMDVLRVLRGGSWRGDLTSYLRGAVRDVNSPGYFNFVIGFRCVRDSAP